MCHRRKSVNENRKVDEVYVTKLVKPRRVDTLLGRGDVLGRCEDMCEELCGKDNGIGPNSCYDNFEITSGKCKCIVDNPTNLCGTNSQCVGGVCECLDGLNAIKGDGPVLNCGEPEPANPCFPDGNPCEGNPCLDSWNDIYYALSDTPSNPGGDPATVCVCPGEYETTDYIETSGQPWELVCAPGDGKCVIHDENGSVDDYIFHLGRDNERIGFKDIFFRDMYAVSDSFNMVFSLLVASLTLDTTIFGNGYLPG